MRGDLERRSDWMAELRAAPPATVAMLGALAGLALYGSVMVAGPWVGAAAGGAVLAVWAQRALGDRVRVRWSRTLQLAGVALPVELDDAHLHAAWRIFVQLETRIATQPLPDGDGDDGVALASVQAMFTALRAELLALPPHPTSPGTTSIEVVAIRLLNSVLRPFLARWHPRWEGRGAGEPWDSEGFRRELALTQAAVAEYAEQIGRMLDVDPVVLRPPT